MGPRPENSKVVGRRADSPTWSWRTIVWLAVAGTMLRLTIAWSGAAEGNLIADDAYYYFQIARNLAAGLGPTFDGLAPTNGFQPLWLGMLTPVFAVVDESLWIPVRLALTLSTMLDLVTGLMLVRILALHGASRSCALVAGLWYLSPLTVLVGLRGMESSLATCLVVAVFWRLPTVAGGRRADAILVGLLVGLAGLARTDNLAALGAAVTVSTLMTCGWKAGIRQLLVVGAMALLVMTPWWGWNIVEFGSPVQVSGLVKANFPIYGTLAFDWSSWKGVARALSDLTIAPLFHAARFAAHEEFATARLAHLGTLAMVAMVLVPLLRARTRPVAGTLLASAWTYFAVHVLVMCWIWQSYINWYALPSLAVHALIVGVVLVPMRIGWPLRAVGVILACCFFVRFFAVGDHGPAMGERDNADRFAHLAASYPDGVIAGAFNAGVYGYVAPAAGDIRVINLDGRVNNAAYAAAREGSLAAMIAARVEVLLEPPGAGYQLLSVDEISWLEERYRKHPDLALWERR